MLNQLSLDNYSLFNIDQIELSRKEEIILGLGLKYIPHHSATTQKIIDSLTSSLNDFQRQLRLQTFFRNPFNTPSPIPKQLNNTWIPPAANDYTYVNLVNLFNNHFTSTLHSLQQMSFVSRLTPQEKYIKNTLFQIRQRQDIVIQPADKNLGTCVLSRTLYNQYCYKILSDFTTYQFIFPTTNLFPTFIKEGYARLRGLLNKHNMLWRENRKRKFDEYQNPNQPPIYYPNERVLTKLAASLLQLEHSNLLRPTGKFYILLKMHKPTISGRPIVNCINTMTYHASKYLDKLLQPILPLLSTISTSSLHTTLLLDKITSVPTNAVIFCADVSNLYPSIPIEFGLIAVRTLLSRFLFPDIDFIIDLLRWVLKHNYLSFENNIYRQVSGTAMGTPCAPVYANLVLFYIEEPLLSPQHSRPILYQRYLDDIFAIFPSKEVAEQFGPAFNRICKEIQLDAITISNSGIFLDLNISLPHSLPLAENHPNLQLQHSISIKLYQKPSNKYLYIPPTSSHQKHMIENFIFNELLRYKLFNSSAEDFLCCKEKFLQRLQARGYKLSFLRRIFNKPIPSRQDIITRKRIELSLKKNPGSNAQKLKHSPVAILHLPKLKSQSYKQIKQLFSLPFPILKHPYFKQAFPNHCRALPLIARRLGKNLHRLVTLDVSSIRTPRDNQE